MGLISDYLERNRENSNFDICLVLPQSKVLSHTQSSYWSASNAGQVAKEEQKRNREWQLAFVQQAEGLINTENYEQQYTSSLNLLNRCIFRQKQLLQIRRDHQFVTPEVNDTIQEYIELVRYSMEYARERVTEAKSHIQNTSNLLPHDFDESAETSIALVTLVDSLFYYLSVTASNDDSHFVQELFGDISVLIKQLDPVGTEGKKAKQICSDFYEENYSPTYGIETCENCGAKLYKQCPHYCFHCFVYQGRG